MKLNDLNHDEAIVLLGFMRVIIHADGEFSDAERQRVGFVRDAMGEEAFDRALADASQRFPTTKELKEFAKAAGRPEACKLIHDVLVNIAESDTLTTDEEKPLRWIESWWSINAAHG